MALVKLMDRRPAVGLTAPAWVVQRSGANLGHAVSAPFVVEESLPARGANHLALQFRLFLAVKDAPSIAGGFPVIVAVA